MKETTVDTVLLGDLWHLLEDSSFACAMWRLPYQPETHLLVDTSGESQRIKIDTETLPSGFALGPFVNPNGEQSRFLRADIHLIFTQNQAEQTPEKILSFFEELQTNKKSHKKVPTSITATEIGTPLMDTSFRQSVKTATEAIRRGEMQKVVLSRTKEFMLSNDFQLFEAFDVLCETYPNAFVSLVYLPDENVYWLGASPEVLVSEDSQGIFRTMSLAGTQSALEGTQPKRLGDAVWSHKEIEEQALVSRYIIDCFKKIRLREYTEIGPKTVRAGNLLHLRTDYQVDTRAVRFPELLDVMLELLHPTSAVCGTPKQPAMAFITTHEAHQREWYSGFLGPVNIARETQLFVNLRTAKITTNRLCTLYAGVGITEDSDPEKEFLETEMKFRTLSFVLGS